MSKKKNILEAAICLFAEKGYKEASMAELAKITGVAQGTIFYHYRSKEELFLSILKNFKQTLIEKYDEYFKEKRGKNGLEMMEQAVEFYFYLAEDMEEQFILLYRHEAYELAHINPAFRECLEDIYDCFINIFRKAIIKGQEDGSIVSLPEKKLALIIFTMIDGFIRLNIYKLYNAGSIYSHMIEACIKILKT